MAKRTFPIVLPRDKALILSGGPYRERPPGYFGVKMAKEITAPCDVDIPTADFNVPAKEAVDAGLIAVLQALLRGDKKVYVGCMGGIGRTGLFLGVLARAFNLGDPVKYVRAMYLGHALETDEQQAWARGYKVPWKARLLVWRIKLKALFVDSYAVQPPIL